MFALSLVALSALSVSATTITSAPTATPTAAPREKRATTSPLPLTAYTYAYDQVPYQVNPYNVGRGPQSGYNQVSRREETLRWRETASAELTP